MLAHAFAFLAVISNADASSDGEPAAPTADIADISLDELLNLSTGVATRAESTVRESPAIITIFTRDDIVALGARDLLDVLWLVPGFQLGVDVQSTVGIGVRGNWGAEGKVLLLIDGQVMNEGLYLTTQLAHQYPVDNIEKIEIIRGPGSVTYGGYAELAVINVISRSGAQIRGLSIGGTYGQSARGFMRRYATLTYGQLYDSGLDMTLTATVGQGNLGEFVYRDIYGTSYSLADGDAKADPRYVNIGAAWKGLNLRFIYSDFRMTQRDAFDAVTSRAARQDFYGLHGEASYELKLEGTGVKVNERVSWKRQRPWYTSERFAEFQDVGIYYLKEVDRLTGSLAVSYDTPLAGLNLLGGIEGYVEEARLLAPQPDAAFDGEDDVRYDNYASFAQVLWNNPVVNVSAGARLEQHSQYGESFVPRVGLTKVVDRWHMKLLYSQAFKAPGVENIRLNADIKPERTAVLEAETGYQLSDVMFASVNVFDINISDPIIYTVTDSAEGYTNQDNTGTRGAELEYRLVLPKAKVSLSYSYYTAAGRDQPANYAVVTDSDCPADEEGCLRSENLLLGFAAHKVALSATVRPLPDLDVTTSAVALSERYGYSRSDELGETAFVDSQEPTLLLNVFARYDNLGISGLSLGLGVFNILGEKFSYVQPYDGWHAPFPASAREYLVRVEYTHPMTTGAATP
jgi:outer membrane cobalamin receptor